MKLSRAQVRQTLEDVLAEVQALGEQPLPELRDDTRPLDELPGFDSLVGVEATVLLAERLGVAITVETVFLPVSGSSATLTDIVVRVLESTKPAR